MTKLSWWKAISLFCLFFAAGAIASPEQTFKSLVSFNGTDGSYTSAGLVQGFDGNFYGTTSNGGSTNAGTVFKITPSGTLSTLHSFDFTDGNYPSGALVQATDGNLYGTTQGGGASTDCGTDGCGTVFKITPSGTLTTLHSFDFTDGAFPYAGLVQATNGSFYGTTVSGGVNGGGTVFEITPGGKLTTLYSFCSQTDCTDGRQPYAGLVQATDGNFYGTTTYGGADDAGTVFEITAGGTLSTLHSFDGTDGSNPAGGLVQATNDFYATTSVNGAGIGTIFEITAGGTLTTLHSFGGIDGINPRAGVVQATNGNFYGTTYEGGTSGNCSGGCGTVFSLAVRLGPFVQTIPTSGKVGTKLTILGNNLTGATSVTFNDTPAVFTVPLTTEITTTVPSGATTGKVEVTVSGHTLTSNVKFQVK